MWSGPRNISTALMYSFAQRDDTKVVDEPLYAHYLHETGADHPGREEVMASQEKDGTAVLRDLLCGESTCAVLFVKQMAHHLVGIDMARLDEARNVLLIRDPRYMLPSLVRVLGDVTLADTGLEKQVAILEHLERRGLDPFCIDSRELLRNPETILRGVCDRLGLPFQRCMLAWPRGPRAEDGVWAKYWYEGVHRSSGFQPWKPSTREIPAQFEPLLDQCIELYDILFERAIRAPEEQPND